MAKKSKDNKSAAKAARADERAKKVKAKAEAAAAKKAEREKNRMPKQNGVTRPKPGTKCASAWELFDAISKETRKPCTIGAATEAKPKGLNDATLRTQYSRWRKFHNITGRLESAAKPAKAKAKAKAKGKVAKKASAPKAKAKAKGKSKAKAKTSAPAAEAPAAAPPVTPPTQEAPASEGGPSA